MSPPFSDWLPQVAAIALPLVGSLSAAMAAAIAVALTTSWRPGGAVCVGLCVAVFAGWTLGGPGLGSPPSPTETDRTLRVISLNVGDSHGQEGQIAQYVVDSDADVVVFQEAASGGGPYHSAVARVMLEGYEPLVDQAGGLGRQVTLTRLPAAAYGTGYLGEEGADFGVYTRAVLRVGEIEVAVYNVHFRSFGRWRESPQLRSLRGLREDIVQRAVEAERLRAILDAEPLPYIVAGDLNSTPDQWAYQRVAEGSRDALANEGGALPRTYPSHFPLVQIDVVFASPEFDVVGASVGPPGLSDHRPVGATLAVGDND